MRHNPRTRQSSSVLGIPPGGEGLQSFFMGGFECSSHIESHGARLDLIAATRHDAFVLDDYRRLRSEGLLVAREGLRWHLIEARPGQYDFSSVLPVIRAARREGVQVIWDLLHYGWPDFLDIYSTDFITHFARLAREFALLLQQESGEVLYITPVNEISYLAWCAGDVARFYPFGTGRGDELKRVLVRASIAAMDEIRSVDARTRFVAVEPNVNVVTPALRPDLQGRAAGENRAQFDAWDMLAGRLAPELGGRESYLDIIGVNYYANNQWFVDGSGYIRPGSPEYKPFHRILQGLHERYRRSIIISETGTEDEARPDWLRYIGDETRLAMQQGVPVSGICLYPILNHPGWADGRHCCNGLWDYCNEDGEREIYEPLAAELARQQHRFAEVLSEEGER